MNPYACRVALRVRTPPEVFDLAAHLFRLHGARSLKADQWVMISAGAVVVALTLLPPPWDLGALVAGWLAAPATRAPVTAYLGRALFADTVDPAALPRAANRAATGWLALGQAGVIAAGLATCGVGAPVALVLSAFLPQVLVLEQVAPSVALRRATSLASEHLGAAVVGTLFEAGLVLWGALALESTMYLVTGELLLIGEPFGSLADGDLTPWTALGAMLGYHFATFVRMLQYVDARTRREGWDIQVALHAAAEGR